MKSNKWDFKCPVCSFMNARNEKSLKEYYTTHDTECSECGSKVKILGDSLSIYNKTTVLEGRIVLKDM